MKKSTISKCFTMFKLTYPNGLQGYGEEEIYALVNIWYEQFKRISDEEFSKACSEHLKTGKFFPTIADIFQIIERDNAEKINPDEEFEEIRWFIKNKYRGNCEVYFYEDPYDMHSSYKIIRTGSDEYLSRYLSPVNVLAWKRLGYDKLNDTEQRKWVKKEYDAIVKEWNEGKRVEFKKTGELTHSQQIKIGDRHVDS